MKNLVSRFMKDESGATAIEYGLIATLIGVAIIAGATALGTTLNSTFQGVADNDALGGGGGGEAAGGGEAGAGG